MQRLDTITWIAAASLSLACSGPTKSVRDSDKGQQVAAADDEAEAESRLATEVAESLPVIPDTPQPAPASLLATVEAANPLAVWAALAAYADAVQAGAGDEFKPEVLAHGVSEILELTRADAVDLGRPMRLLILDPREASPPFVAVVYASDDKALQDAARQGGGAAVKHGEVFAVGTRLGLQAAAPYALTTLVASPAPEAPRVTIYVRKIMDRYRTTIDPFIGMIRAEMSGTPGPEGELMGGVFEGLLAVVSQIDTVVGVMDADAKTAGGTLAVHPIANSGLAGFIAAQKPSSYTLLEAMPDRPVVFAGELETEPIRDALTELIRTATEFALGSNLADTVGQILKLWDHLDGEIAGVAAFTKGGGYGFGSVAKIKDARGLGKEMAARARELAKAARVENKLVYTFRPGGLRHRGVTLNAMSLKLGPKATDKERALLETMGGASTTYSGAFDTWMVSASGRNSKATARSLIDGLKSKRGAVPAWLAPVAAESRAHKESLLLAVDGQELAAALQGQGGGGPVSPGLALGLGFDGGAMTGRMSVPAAQVAAIMALTRAMTAPQGQQAAP